MYTKYDKNTFSSLNRQHNIMVLVGNGFDVALLKRYNKGRMEGKTSSYDDFYEYIKYFGLSDENNYLFKKMTEDRMNNKKNWSDFELAIGELVNDSSIPIKEIEQCVDQFQIYFTRFLNELVNADVLVEINEEVQRKKLAKQSLGKFIKDLDKECTIKFSQDKKHYDLYNYLFVNFNYTALLDNYLYMDKNQFDPHVWSSADRNFNFYPDLCQGKGTETELSSYLTMDIVHPHGMQDVPRSILFGIDIPNYDKGTSKEKRLIKSYWSQYDVRYKSYFEETELFIIYGMSISISDGWWLDNIFDAILKKNAELIIYKYGNESEEDIKDLFVAACIRHLDVAREDVTYIKERVYVVTFEKNDTYFLGLEQKIEK